MQFHESCDTLSILSFHKVFETNDYRWLLIDIASVTKLNQEQNSILAKAFKKILYEYSDLTRNRKLLVKMEKELQIAKLQIEYDICSRALELFNDYEFLDILDILREYGYTIDLNKDLNKQLDVIILKLKRLSTRINVLIANYNNRFKKEDEPNEVNLYKEAVHLEMALKLSYSLDLNKTSVTKWATLHNIAKDRT